MIKFRKHFSKAWNVKDQKKSFSPARGKVILKKENKCNSLYIVLHGTVKHTSIISNAF